MNSTINVSNLTIDYGNGRGIFDFNFNIKKGEVHAIVGTNGSGKTTTLRVLMGFLKARAGSATIEGMDVWNDAKSIKEIVSYVPGEINFPDVGSGESFLKIQMGFYGIKDSTYMNRLVSLFGLDTRVPLRRMSKGMKQKCALVCAFMKDSPIILLDEPSTGLDPLMRDNLIELINQEKKKGKTIIMSSHIFKEIEDTCDKVTFIDDGHIIETIDMADIKDGNRKEYLVEFDNINDYEAFVKATSLELSKIDSAKLRASVFVSDDSINEMFDELSSYKVSNIEYIPFTLEKYYEESILGGNIDE